MVGTKTSQGVTVSALFLSQIGEEGKIELNIELDGPLSDEQRSELLEIAERCPVHQTLTSETVINVGSADESG